MKNSIRISLIVFLISVLFLNLYPQNKNDMKKTIKNKSQLEEFLSFRSELEKIFKTHDKNEKSKIIDSLWDSLKKSDKIPFTAGNYTAFLYRGEADSVAFQGDFTSWGRIGAGGNWAQRLPDTDFWVLEKEFPEDARLDYKIVINGKSWILDPANPHTQMSGYGANSELRMPGWKPSPWVVRDDNLPAVKLSDNIRIKSKALNYDLIYRIYLPYGYGKTEKLPVIYVTDGHEYSDDAKGSMVTILDNLIAKGKIKPVIAVFIDPRDPDSLSMNKRESQFLMNEKYLSFVCDELIPEIDAKYKTDKNPDSRAILGTSFGGVCATYFALMRSNVFHLAGIQSPAYWSASKLQSLREALPKLSLKLFISTGTINDGEMLTRMIKKQFEEDGFEILYKEVSEGHSWGNWRSLLDDMLVYFWGK